MPSMGANAKIVRAVNQLENSERLILSLPKRFFKDRKQRELIENAAREIYRIKESLERELSNISQK